MGVMNVAEVILKFFCIANFFSILIDGSTVHRKEKEVLYIQSFQREEFM